MESKKDIRKKIFAERKLHTDEQIEAMSRTITDKVTALPAFKKADRILVYADYNHEVVTEYLIKEAWKAGKEVAERSENDPSSEHGSDHRRYPARPLCKEEQK